MNGYSTVVVGTDGSRPSMHAVDRAAWIAAASDAKLIIAMAHVHHSEDDLPAVEDFLKGEGYQVHGEAPVYEWLHEAHERATAAGAKKIEERPIVGTPVDALVSLVREAKADLLVVGNLGMSTLKGRLLGSVPASITHRAPTDVLVVHTRD